MKKQKKVEKKYFFGSKLQRKSTFESKVLWTMFKKIWTLFKNLRDVQTLHVWITMASLKKLSHGPLGIQPEETFATRPPSKAEDMGLSQGSFVSFLKERVKEVFTSIHVSVESTKPAEVYTTRRWHSWELRRELAILLKRIWNICSSPHLKCCINVGFREAPCKKSFGILASYWTPPKIK